MTLTLKPKRKPVAEPLDLELTQLDCPHFDQIVHVSDVHIRPLKRHQEFEQCFKALAQDLVKLKQEGKQPLIVITGDILDSKHVFKPETFYVCRRFLKMLSMIGPTLVIAGNHDMLERNTSRLDALTPMVMDCPNLFYLKNTGVYQTINNPEYFFAVSSLYDKHFVTSEQVVACLEQQQDLDYNKETAKLVALYHGSIVGAKTENFTVGEEEGEGSPEQLDSVTVKAPVNSESDGTTRFKRLSDFEGFTAVMLGDIHLQQNFQLKSGGVVSYAGSLIQQNHGESLRGHGYLLWPVDLPVGVKPRLVEIANPCGFVTVKIRDGEVVVMPKSLPATPYLRLDVESTPEVLLDQVIQGLLDQEKIKPCEITKRLVQQQISSAAVPEEIIKKHDDAELIKTILTESDAAQWQETILALHAQYFVENERQFSFACWKPVSIEFTNMFGYSHNTEHRLDLSNGVYSLSAPNQTGKTSLINTVLFAIFGKLPLNPSRSTKFDIVNNNQTHGRVAIILQHGGNYYRIERETKRKTTMRKGNGAAYLSKLNGYDFNINFHQVAGPGLEEQTQVVANLTERSLSGTDVAITRLFGTIEDFLITNLINKESNKSIISMSDADRVKIMTQLFNVKMYEKYQQLNKKAIKDLDTQLSEHQGQLKAINKFLKDVSALSNVDELKQQREEFETDLADQKERLANLQTELTSLHGHIKEQQAGLKPVDRLAEQVDPEILEVEYNQLCDSWAEQAGVPADQVEISDPNINQSRLLTENAGHQQAITRVTAKIATGLPSPERLEEQIKQLTSSYDFQDLTQADYDQTVSEMAVCVASAKRLQQQLGGASRYTKADLDDGLPSSRTALESALAQAEEALDRARSVKRYYVNNQAGIDRQLTQVEETILQYTQDQVLTALEIEQLLVSQAQEVEAEADEDANAEHLNGSGWWIPSQNFKRVRQCLIDLHQNTDRAAELVKLQSQMEQLRAQQVEIGQHTEHNRQADQLQAQTQTALDQLKLQLEVIDYLERSQQLSELEQDLEGLKVQRQYLELLQQRQQLEQNSELNQEIELYQNKIKQNLELIERQKMFDRLAELEDLMDTQERQRQDLELNRELNQDLTRLRDEYRQTEEQLDELKRSSSELESNLKTITKTIAEYEAKSDQIELMKADQTKVVEELANLERELEGLKLYDKVVGKKGIQARILYFKLKAIETYINKIIANFTKYSVEVVYDDDKNTISFITKNTQTGKYLSAERLCGYEKVILDIAVKRALNKYSANSKSSIMIVDEGFDVLDEAKFTGNSQGSQLSTLMNILLEDYSQCLIVSQRNLDHIADHHIKIYRDKDGVARINA